MAQSLIVALIVAAAAAYACWALMPARWRLALATRLARRLGRPLPAAAAGGCGGCGGCDGAAPAPGAPKTITVHRRLH